MVELTSSFLMEYEALDKEHQALADLVNQVVKAIDGNEPGKCKSLVKQFVELAKEHFSNEEALLLKTGFPNLVCVCSGSLITENMAAVDNTNVTKKRIISVLKFIIKSLNV